MKQMHADDAVWLYIEPPGESMHVTLISVYDAGERGPLTRSELQAIVEDRVVSRLEAFGHRLQQVPLRLDFPYWVDDAGFDVERHVRERTVARPGDMRALLQTVTEVHAEPLDKRHPLWDFTLISGIDGAERMARGSFAVACRFHHAMVDGKSIMEVAALMHDASPGGAPPTPVPARRGAARAPTLLQVGYRAGTHAVRNPIGMLTGVGTSLPALGAGLVRRRLRLSRPGRRAPRTRFSGTAGPRRSIGFIEVELGRLRELRALAPESTINDVVLAVVAGAMRAYLDALGELPDAPLVTSCPISLRTPQPTPDALARAAAPAPGNQVSAMFVPLATDLPDARERLRAIAAATRAAKDSRETVSAKILAQVQGNMQATASAAVSRLLLLATEHLPFINTIVSNVPGSQEPLYLAGRQLRLNTAVTALLSGLTLLHVVTSYNGNLVISFVADADALPDPERYERLLHESLAELETGSS